MCSLISKKLFRCFIVVLLVLSISFPVSAESEWDYSYPMSDEYIVEEALLGKVNYRICSCDVLHEDAMGVFWPVNGVTYSSVEKINRIIEQSTHKMDLTTKTDRFPESYLDIISSYDEAFFEENFLAVAFALLRKTDEFSIKRIDHIKNVSLGPAAHKYSVSIILDFDDIPGDEYIEENMSIFYIFVELPKEYCISEDCVVGFQESSVTYNWDNPKTGDNVMLIPAMGAMVTAAAGIVITRKRRK